MLRVSQEEEPNFWGVRSQRGEQVSAVLGLLSVPATVGALFVVIAAVAPQLGPATHTVLQVVPVYIAFAVLAPLAGRLVGRVFRLDEPARRSVAFSAATRNSLVVLPLALVVPGDVPMLPTIIITQTLVKLVSELVYERVIRKCENVNPQWPFSLHFESAAPFPSMTITNEQMGRVQRLRNADKWVNSGLQQVAGSRLCRLFVIVWTAHEHPTD